MSIFTDKDRQYSREWSATKVAQAKPTGFMENLSSSWDNFVNNETQFSARDNMRELVEQRRATVLDMTGIDIDDPYSGMPSWIQGASTDSLPAGSDETLLGGIAAATDPMRILFGFFDRKEGGNEEARLLAHEEAINAARARLPENQWHMIPTLEQLREQMQTEASEIEQRNSDIASRATVGGVVGQLAGAMGAAVTQPEILATLPIGAPARVGFLQRVLIEASIGAGVETAIQPGVQRNREDMGLESSFEQALGNIAMAGVGTGVLTGAMTGALAVVRGGANVFQRRFGRPPTPSEQAAIDLARQAVENERATPYQQRTAAAARVYQANEEQATVAALEGRPIEEVELEQDRALIQRVTTSGAALRSFTNDDLDSIEVDAQLMQFKTGGDEFGVTERLQGVTTWEVERAGVALVYEHADGRLLIADGHQRLGLARRLAAQGQEVELPAIVIREIDGVTPEQARARAAFKNIAEGTGTATDAAKILRDLGARSEDLNLPPRSALVRDAEGLARLDDDVFGMVINEILPERFAAIIGRLVNDPYLQRNVAQLLARLQPANAIEAEQIVMQARSAGVSRGTQSTLFGEEDIAESLYLERARVLDRSIKMLRRNQTTFRTLLEQEGEITGTGNVLDQTANKAKLDADRMLMAYVQAQANRKGPIGDALSEAARLAKESGNYQQPARQFVQALTRAIESGDVARDIGRADRDAAEFTTQDPQGADGTGAAREVVPDEDTFSMFDEPTGEAVARQADAINAEVRDRIEAEATGIVQPTIGQPVRVDQIPENAISEVKYRFKMDTPARTVDEIYATAQRWQDELSQIGRTIGRRKGVQFKNPGLKARETTVGKVSRKGYTDTRELTDIVRGGFVVETPAQADAIADTLSGRFAVLDEGWNVTPEGYFDRKMLVKFEDGTIGEVQIWHPDMISAKDRRGHKLYTQMRSMEETDPRYQSLIEEMRALYGGVAGKLDDQWRSVLDDFISGNASGRPGNLVANRSGDSTDPDSATSSSRAPDHESELSGTNQADDPTMMAGRPSQSTNDVLDMEALSVAFGANTSRTSQLEAMDIPVGERIDTDGNRVPETQTVRQILDELEEDQNFIEQLNLCDRSSRVTS